MRITTIEVKRMFLTGLNTRVTGYTTKEGAIMKYAPDGTVIAEIILGIGGGNERYPVMWVKVPVWGKLAEKALKAVDRRGIAVEASGMLQVRQYEGKYGKSVSIELKGVSELIIHDREGELIEVLSVEKAEK